MIEVRPPGADWWQAKQVQPQPQFSQEEFRDACAKYEKLHHIFSKYWTFHYLKAFFNPLTAIGQGSPNPNIVAVAVILAMIECGSTDQLDLEQREAIVELLEFSETYIIEMVVEAINTHQKPEIIGRNAVETLYQKIRHLLQTMTERQLSISLENLDPQYPILHANVARDRWSLLDILLSDHGHRFTRDDGIVRNFPWAPLEPIQMDELQEEGVKINQRIEVECGKRGFQHKFHQCRGWLIGS
jgi:hypothetical protein